MIDRRQQDAMVREYLRRLGWGLREMPDDDREQLMAEISDHIAVARAGFASPTDHDVRLLLDRLGPPEAIVAEAAAQSAGRPVTRFRAVGPVAGAGAGDDLMRQLVEGPGGVWAPGSGTAAAPAPEAAESGAEQDPDAAPKPPAAPRIPRAERRRRPVTVSARAAAAALAEGDRELRAVSLLLAGGLLLVIGWFAGLALLWRSRIFTLSDKLIGTTVLPGGLLPAIYVLFWPVGARGNGGLHLLEFTLCMLLPITTSVYLHRRLRAVQVATRFESFRARRAAHAAERERNEMGLG